MAFSIEWHRAGRTNAIFAFALVACNLSTQVLTDHEPTRGPSARYPHLCIDAVNGEPDLSDVSIKLTRTWGMGSPPQYALRLDGNGRCEYKGSACVLFRAKAAFKIDKLELLAILDAFDQLDFLDYEHFEPVRGHANLWYGRPTDVASEVISLQVGTRTRRFENYGHQELFPDESDPHYHSGLADLADLIDRSVIVEQWIGTDGDRAARFGKH